jgi:glycosyltransferase involved in cell wall biosynthesis
MSIERNRSAEMQELVKDANDGWEPDVIFVDSWLMAQYLPPDYAGLRILHEHNAEFQLWERQAELESGPRKPLATREADRVRRYEAEALQRFDVVFAVSDADREALKDLGADPNRLRVLPNIPDPALLDAAAPVFEDTETLILYLGTLSWQPNIEGVERFTTSVFPRVRKSIPDARLVVAGRGASKQLAETVRRTDGAEFAGEIDDPEDVYEHARVFVDATRTGGGTRLKVLNALARGVPVVASPQAAAGLDLVANEHIVISRNDDAMADAITKLMNDPARWKILSENARALVRSRYVAEAAFRPLDEELARARGKR